MLAHQHPEIVVVGRFTEAHGLVQAPGELLVREVVDESVVQGLQQPRQLAGAAPGLEALDQAHDLAVLLRELGVDLIEGADAHHDLSTRAGARGGPAEITFRP